MRSEIVSDTRVVTPLHTNAKNHETCDKAVLRIRNVYLGSRIQIFSIPDSGSEFSLSRIRIKEFKYFNPKNCFQALGNMIRVVHPGTGS
jgi:hypothetical protein